MVLDSNKVVVLDNGSGNIKVGLAADETPKLVPNAVMKKKGARQLYIGPQIINGSKSKASLLSKSAFELGYMMDAELERQVWQAVFDKDCMGINPADTTLVVTEPVFNFAPIQETLDEIAFEEFGFDGLFRAPAADLAAYRNYRTVGAGAAAGAAVNAGCMIVDAGFAFTHTIPYFNCRRIDAGIRRMDVGGKMLTNYLKRQVSFRQLDLNDETYVVNQMKEDVCFVSQNYTADAITSAKKPNENGLLLEYTLPDFESTVRGSIRPREDMMRHIATDGDGQSVRLSNERFSVPELLFQPSDGGVHQIGVSDCVVNSVASLPPTVQPSLLANISIVGGCGRLPGFKERLTREVRAAASTAYADVNVVMDDAPELQAWHGGSALAKTAAFADSMVVTKAQWHEEGHELCKARFLAAQTKFAEAV